MLEMGVVIGRDGTPLHWHAPEGRTGAALPDSRALWDVLWEGRDALAGVAHTHPGAGRPAPSLEDLTTFSAIERGLGRRLMWWLVSATEVVACSFCGPDALAYGVEPVPDPPWAGRLRRLSFGR
jgi:hypothetical protein